MIKQERKKLKITNVAENSLNFELAKVKNKIKANYSLVSQNNLFIFTKECAVCA